MFCSSYLYNNSGKQWRHTHAHAGTLLLVVNNNNEYYNAARAHRMCIKYIQRRAYCMYNRVRISSTGLPAIRCCHIRDIHIYTYIIYQVSSFFIFSSFSPVVCVCARARLLILTHTQSRACIGISHC